MCNKISLFIQSIDNEIISSEINKNDIEKLYIYYSEAI